MVTLKDLILTILGSGISELVGGDFFAGIIISLILTGISNVSLVNIQKINGSILAQIEDFEAKYITEEGIDEDSNTTFDISKVGMKISIKHTTRDNNVYLPFFYIDHSLIEAWDSEDRVLRTVEGPKYYWGVFKTDSDILGNRMGFNVETVTNMLRDVFNIVES